VRSFGILSTNVGLTTNIKIMVGASYSLSLESINSKEELESNKFKKVSFIKDNYYDELVKYFYEDLPVDTAFHVKYENDVESMSDDFALQYDELYQYGARNIVNNKNYNEEFEYFAPLYISPNNLPKKFIIFRVDGSGIGSITKKNIKSSIFQNFKTVKIFDLTKYSYLGEWLDINFNNNSFFPLTPFEMSFENLEFSKWNGIDYRNGGYTSKSMFLENIYNEEREIFEFEKLVFDGYKNNSIVFPNILNLSFLFDDTPANSDSLRKWSINRYYGFYLEDMIQVKTLSPYITPFLKSDVVIQNNNILYSPTGDPFIEGFLDHKVYYVEYLGEYYKVEKYEETGSNTLQSVKRGTIVTQEYIPTVFTKYKIISDIDLSGKQSLLNNNTGRITSDKKLINYDNTNFIIEDWSSADIWLIEIDGMYHNLIKDTTDDSIKINSDYTFEFNENDYTYWINKNDPSYTKKVSFLVNSNSAPKKFKIYKLKFTDIKDFDTKIVDTEYSKYEYEKKYELTETDETKMYLVDLLSNSNPKDYDDFIYRNNVVHIPVASEYTANYETFKVEKGELSEIWRKNPTYCRWGFQNSNSANDVPYLLNNSLLFEDYNRTVNPFDPNPKRIERNLDYFYTINSSTSSYTHHSLHIENNLDGVIDNTFRFELDKYLNLGTYSIGTSSAPYNFDYFTYFFERKAYFDSGNMKKNVKKYSLFNSGDKSIPNITLFKGIKFIIYDVESIKKDDTDRIGVLNIKTSNSFDGYKFSILLSDNEWSVTSNGGITSSANLMSWTIFDDWKMDKVYNLNDIVINDDILYKSTTFNNIVSSPVREYVNVKKTKSAPYNQSNWIYYKPTKNVFWSPTSSYPGDGIGNDTYKDVVFNHEDYYVYDSLIGGTDDFWSPYISDTTGYTASETVLFKGKYYMSMTSSNRYRPDFQSPFVNFNRTSYEYYWAATQSSSPKWRTVELWNPSIYYPALPSATYSIHNDILYKTVAVGTVPYGSETGNEPGLSTDWERVYSLKPDTSVIYTPTVNPIIEMNDSYYMINSNSSSSTLENGINIYINKKWKNILINITITDNTVPNLSESDRDILYNDLNKKLTANNFIQSINDIVNKYDYTDYLNYIIIEEDGSISKYNYNNIEGLPYYITCETPEEVTMKYNSLSYKPLETPKNLKSSRIITSISNDLSNLNDYNKVPIAADISGNEDTPKPMVNYSGSNDITEDTIYRFSGYYMPIFYDIQLFSKSTFTSSVGNYIFDIDLSEFGIMKERKIRKVNKEGSVLKLRDDKEEKSIYPMLDEFGYTTTDFFIFSSSWEYEYYVSTSLNTTVQAPIVNPSVFAGSQGQYVNIGILANSNQNLSF
jgi:hypothetical protein